MNPPFAVRQASLTVNIITQHRFRRWPRLVFFAGSTLFAIGLLALQPITLRAAREHGEAPGTCVIPTIKIGSVSGQVISKQEGVPKVTLQLRDWKDQTKTLTEISTDDDGRFDLATVNEGKYLLVVGRKLYSSLYIPIRVGPGNKTKGQMLVIHLAPDYMNPCSEGGVELKHIEATANIRDESWRGIVPLKSTRTDVERLLGKPNPGELNFLATYNLQNEEVHIHYAVKRLCRELQRCECQVPDDTVIEVSVKPKRQVKFSTLNLDKARFVEFPQAEDVGIAMYHDGEAGLTYAVRRRDDNILYIQYGPAAKGCEEVGRLRSPRTNADSPLSLQGQVIKAELEREGQQQIYHLKLKLEFANTGEKSRILLLGTYGEKNEWWVRDVWLSRSRGDALAGKSFSSRSVAPANSRSLPKWKRLRRSLQASTPPPSLTQIIKPHQTYVQYLETFVVLDEGDNISSRSTIWLQLALELWPFNLERVGARSEAEFSNRLMKRWQRIGELWREPVLSAPIRFDLGEYHVAGKR